MSEAVRGIAFVLANAEISMLSLARDNREAIASVYYTY